LVNFPIVEEDFLFEFKGLFPVPYSVQSYTLKCNELESEDTSHSFAFHTFT
jgi:hypothetical protein